MTEFSVQHQENNTIDILTLIGYLDAHTAPILEDKIRELKEKSRIRIIMSCKDIDYISSAGLGVFMVFIEDVRLAGGDIKFTDMPEKIFLVFDLLGFPMLFDILPTVQDAVNKFNL